MGDPFSEGCNALALWGAGGLLTDLEAIEARHGRLPRTLLDLQRALTAAVAEHAPAGSPDARSVHRATPCPLCTALAGAAATPPTSDPEEAHCG